MTEINYATALELRAIADVIDTQNEVYRGLEANGSTVYLDNITVTDTNGMPLAVLVWRSEADSFGVAMQQSVNSL